MRTRVCARRVTFSTVVIQIVNKRVSIYNVTQRMRGDILASSVAATIQFSFNTAFEHASASISCLRH